MLRGKKKQENKTNIVNQLIVGRPSVGECGQQHAIHADVSRILAHSDKESEPRLLAYNTQQAYDAC